MRGPGGLCHRRCAPRFDPCNTFGTGTYDDRVLEQAVEQVFDLKPASIIRDLDLLKPIYRNLAAYGHMGREDLKVKWEETSRIPALLKAVGEVTKMSPVAPAPKVGALAR